MDISVRMIEDLKKWVILYSFGFWLRTTSTKTIGSGLLMM
jgi:hypothetical protein